MRSWRYFIRDRKLEKTVGELLEFLGIDLTTDPLKGGVPYIVPAGCMQQIYHRLHDLEQANKELRADIKALTEYLHVRVHDVPPVPWTRVACKVSKKTVKP
jgi:hypothetical protein